MLLTLKIIVNISSDWTWHNLWSLLAINFKYKYFHNSVGWSGLYLQVYIPSWLAKMLKFTVFRLLESAFGKLRCPCNDLIINILHVEQLSKKFVPNFPWKAFRKRSLHTLWGETLCSCSTGRWCGGICSLNIWKEMRTKT